MPLSYNCVTTEDMLTPKKDFVKDPIYISYTSLSDFLKCQRAFYFKNIYRHKIPVKEGEEPHEPFRIQIASPYLSLGSTVHDAIKWFLEMKGQVTKERLLKKFRNLWLKYRGKRGGFASDEDEAIFGKRGLKMIDNFYQNAKILEKSMPTLPFPKYNLIENIILMGNMDFVGLLPDGTLHVIDFKTGVNDEKDALQLYIYAILSESNYQKEVSKASFWYLDRDGSPKQIVLDPLEPQIQWLINKSLEVKKAIEQNSWVCIKGKEGLCRDCRDYQLILDGKGEFQFTDYRYKKLIYFLSRTQ